jgi:glycosyltransferase involved in cell wall biosynthesis
LYVPQGDARALRAALERLLADEVLRRRVGQEARASAVRHFTFEAYIDALADSVMTAGAHTLPQTDVAL